MRRALWLGPSLSLLLLLSSSPASAQADVAEPAEALASPRAPDAPASVEVTIGLQPMLALGGLSGLGGLGGPGVLGALSAVLAPQLSVAFALTPAIFLGVGLDGSYAEEEGAASFAIGGSVGLLFYGETPRSGAVISHGRGFVRGSASCAAAGTPSSAGYASGALGGALGFTWLPVRMLGLRVEGTVAATGAAPLQGSAFALGLDVGASVALVARL